MGVLKKLDVVIKVLGCAGGVQEHTVSAGSYSELDTWLLTNVDETGRYQVCSAGSSQPLSAKEFERLKSDAIAEEAGSVVLHVRPQPGTVQPSCGRPARPAAPLGVSVREASDGSAPVASWKTDEEGIVAHYEVSIVDENFGPQRCDDVIETQQVRVPAAGRDPHFFMHHLHPGSVHRVEVTAVSDAGISGRSQWVRFCPQGKVEPGSTEASGDLRRVGDLLEPLCAEFSSKMRRDPLFLIIGKQHHGKSSLVNHLIRCLTQKMNTPDQVEAAPPSEKETTIRSKPVSIPFRQHLLTFCDLPAFSTMSRDRKRDLNNLLWCVGSNWARGEESWWPASNPPDAAIIVVSLMSWRDEHDSLLDYLRELQAVLKYERTSNKTTVFPFVVAVTHKDKFLEEEGNAGRDPLAELKKAESQLKSMANTEYVFVLTNYKPSSWWVPAVTSSTYEMLRQVVALAGNRTRAVQEGAFSPRVLCRAIAVSAAVLMALLAYLCKSA